MEPIKKFFDYIGEMEANDPILILARAAKDKAIKDKEEFKKRMAKRVHGKKRQDLENEWEEVSGEIIDLYKSRSETFKEQDLEAGEKGGKWTDADANEYGEKLNEIDEKIEKLLKRRKEIEAKLSY